MRIRVRLSRGGRVVEEIYFKGVHAGDVDAAMERLRSACSRQAREAASTSPIGRCDAHDVSDPNAEIRCVFHSGLLRFTDAEAAEICAAFEGKAQSPAN